MDYNVEFLSEIKNEIEKEVLYKWYISEENDANNNIKLVDFYDVNVEYEGTEINIYNSYLIKSIEEKGIEKNIQTFYPISENFIEIKLKPFFHNNNNNISYSFVGSNRIIDNILLFIEPKYGDEFSTNDKVIAGGSIGFNYYDAYFKNNIIEDKLYFKLELNNYHYEEILNLVETKTISSIYLKLQGIDGFYAEWDPYYFTNKIKIVSSFENQQIQTNNISSLNLKKLGFVREFKLSFKQSKKIK